MENPQRWGNLIFFLALFHHPAGQPECILAKIYLRQMSFCPPSVWPISPGSIHPNWEFEPRSLTGLLAPKVLPAAGGPGAGLPSVASLLLPEVPRAALPRKPRGLHQRPVPVLGHTREKHLIRVPVSITSMGRNAIISIAFTRIVMYLCSPRTHSLVHKWRRISREVGAQENCPKFK